MATMLSQLYVASQVHGGDTTEFFSDKNVPNPPSLSQDGHLNHGTKSDLADELAAVSPISLSSEQPGYICSKWTSCYSHDKTKNGSTTDIYCETILSHKHIFTIMIQLMQFLTFTSNRTSKMVYLKHVVLLLP